MNEDPNQSQCKPGPRSLTRAEVIFEFAILNQKPAFYRAVKAVDGGFRMEKRGPKAKKFRAIMWCGTTDGLFKFREAIELYNRRPYGSR